MKKKYLMIIYMFFAQTFYHRTPLMCQINNKALFCWYVDQFQIFEFYRTYDSIQGPTERNGEYNKKK